MTTTTTENTFLCSDCHQEKPVHTSGGTGYARTDADEKICYECCAVRDRAYMKEHGKTTLYLTVAFPFAMQYSERIGWYDVIGKVSNWPGTLSIPIYRVKVSRHNRAGRRYDVWFAVDGEEWHGYQVGDYTQIIHCKRIKSHR